MYEIYHDILAKYCITPGHYHQWLLGLTYIINKQDFVGSDLQVHYLITPGLWGIVNAMEADKQSYYIDQYGYHLRAQLPNGAIKHCYGYDYGINPASVHRVFDDKVICGKILEQASIRTPPTFLLMSKESRFSSLINNQVALKSWLTDKSFPLIVKPINGRQGRGVHKVMNQKQLNHIINELDEGQLGSPYLMIQPLIPGKDIRVIYFDGSIQLAYERVPAHIIGDGIHTIQELCFQKGFELQWDYIQSYITLHHLTLNTILPVGQKQQLLATANISTGGTAQLYPFDKHDEDFIKHIAHTLGATYFGADIITTGAIHQGTVIELNKMPGFTGANIVQPGFGEELGKKIWTWIKRNDGQ